jgi:hypothetical protein
MGVFQPVKSRDAQSSMAKCDMDVARAVLREADCLHGPSWTCLSIVLVHCAMASGDPDRQTPSRPEEPASLPEHREPTIIHALC